MTQIGLTILVLSIAALLLLVAVAIASLMAFISPLGQAVNIMEMGAGGYTFRDYARVGIPLTILLMVILMVILPLIMPIG